MIQKSRKLKKKKKKNTDHNHDKYIDTSEFKILATNFFNARIAQANLVTNFDNKLTNLNRKIVSNKMKDIAIENELKKLNTFDFGYF